MQMKMKKHRKVLHLKIMLHLGHAYQESITHTFALIEQDNNITRISFIITTTKLYVSVVTLSVHDNLKFLENLKQGLKRTIYGKKYRTEIKTKPKNNNLDYMFDPTFRNINKLFV